VSETSKPTTNLLWWAALSALWLLSTWFDRSWILTDQRLPSWDQAEYLSSALEHGRVLGLVEPGHWQGWGNLLDLSPKIPPLASLISGSVMALTGDGPDQASWVLSLWNAVLLVTVACWGRHLGGPPLGLIAAVLLVGAPALAEHRVEFTLELPLAATSTLALLLLYQWQRPAPDGGQWHQAALAALAIASSLLIKQSALLVVALPAIWSVLRSLRQGRQRQQACFGVVLVLALILPWLHHNWISTIGGTERAVLTSAAEEGDPGLTDLASLIWYPRLWPKQFGLISLTGGIAGYILSGWRNRRDLVNVLRRPVAHLPRGWAWLVGAALAGWACTSLSPNKDSRYIAPVLPMLALILAQGWLVVTQALTKRMPAQTGWILLTTLLSTSTALGMQERWQAIQSRPGSPAIDVVKAIRKRTADQPSTVLLAASDRDLNEQTLSYLGQINGGNIQARRLGRTKGQDELALDQGRWWILVTGDQGTSRKTARALSRRVRSDPRFARRQTWTWSKGRQIELWQRADTAPEPARLDQLFIRHARNLELGPAALAPIFANLGTWHLLDPRFEYQDHVSSWAKDRLRLNPKDEDALWSLALLAVVTNRLEQADQLFSKLDIQSAGGSWPSVYRVVVLMGDWKTCTAAQYANQKLKISTPGIEQVILQALMDTARTTCFDLRGLTQLPRTLPPAIKAIEKSIKQNP